MIGRVRVTRTESAECRIGIWALDTTWGIVGEHHHVDDFHVRHQCPMAPIVLVAISPHPGQCRR
ncbi:MAG: hypothetical protein H6667_05255 [Ardenticatenaceae bacterium]|nr:hypothetical protein [Ardenticatenaceae bacterium]